MSGISSTVQSFFKIGFGISTPQTTDVGLCAPNLCTEFIVFRRRNLPIADSKYARKILTQNTSKGAVPFVYCVR